MIKEKSPVTVIICGRSGTGKSTLEEELIGMGYGRIISCTTRPPREGEKDGVDYYFLTKEVFLKRVENSEFIEWTSYNGNLYGTLKSEMSSEDKVVVLDPNGVKNILSYCKKPYIVYLDATEEVLEQRMRGRGDSENCIAERLQKDRENTGFNEIREIANFVYKVS